MSARNSIQEGFDRLGESARLTKKSETWYLPGEEIIGVVNLQKSQYGRQYYINVGLWLRALSDARYPREQQCHVRTRIEQVFEGMELHIESLLDLDRSMDEKRREEGIGELLNGKLLPLLSTLSSLDSLRSPHGREFLAACLVTGEAQSLLANE